MIDINVQKTIWDLSPLLSGDGDPATEKKLEEVEKKNRSFSEKWKDKNDYLEDPGILKKALDEYEYLMANYGTGGDVLYYFYLRNSQEQNNPEIKAKLNRFEELSTKLYNEHQFFPHRIAKIPRDKQGVFLNYPGLKDYKHFLTRLFEEAKYLLTEEEEIILNLKYPTSYRNWVKMIGDFLAKEERRVINKKGKYEKKSFSEILDLCKDKNKKVRDCAAKVLNGILEKYADTAEVEINSILADKKTDDELRHADRPDLLRHIDDDIDTGVVDSMLDAVVSHYDISKRFYQLKAKLMGVKKIKYYERNVEYGVVDQKYSYEDGVKIVGKTFRNLDAEFYEIFKDYVENGRIDAYPRKGKASGGFSICVLKKSPGYVLLNFTGGIENLTTIAHEMGHAINNELMRKVQNSLNFDTPLCTAEVASTFMEDFVLDCITKGVDDKRKLAILMMRLDASVSAIQRQVACYKFEQELHIKFREKGYLSKEEIGSLFQKHMSAYMGDFVEQSPGSKNWWVHWSHIRNFFYVYSYASGLLISKSLQNSVKHDPKFIEKVKEFLSAGTSDSPKNTFSKLGIDITDKNFWEKGLAEVEKLLDETTILARKIKMI